jgi:hypothetical protein
VDVVDRDKDVRVTAELPGMEEKDMEIEIEGDVLTLRARSDQKPMTETVDTANATSVVSNAALGFARKSIVTARMRRSRRCLVDHIVKDRAGPTQCEASSNRELVSRRRAHAAAAIALW